MLSFKSKKIYTESMNITLENKNFTAVISTHGAEIQNLRANSDGTEYIWTGNPEIWKNHAPILFPFIGRCLDGHFMIDGKRCEYSKNHGFARDLEHKVIFQDKTKVIFELTESEDTLYRFPYHFSLQTEYVLCDDGLDWKITVKNTDSKPFKFGLGTHAAFCCPRNTDPEGTKNSDYEIEFENHEKLTCVLCNKDGFLSSDEKTAASPFTVQANQSVKNADGALTTPYGEEKSGFVPLKAEGFGNGHLFTNFTSNWVGLRNKKDNSLISITSKDFPYCMLWQNTAGKPSFVCIEPWHGLPDSENTNHVWEEKSGMNEINSGESFTSVQNIRISKN